MRIPLDYYRILGVPIQVQAQQLSQAYHDRALQLPRREYSDLAINTRKQLLDEAYTILSDAERREEYDQHFLKVAPANVTRPYGVGTPPGPTPGPTLDIHPEQLIGALLLLYELGEYELVLHLSEPLLQADAVLVPEQMQLVNNPLTRADIVLTVALSCLELGREQWQQGQSDRAAQTGHYAQELLLKEGLFPGIRGELRADMYRLRPYRIVELLTKDESEAELRQKGLRLLQDTLAERGGIEGQGDDQSGLNLDDFLRFMQQIRNHLTTAEQQDLFAVEAQRPSAVGMYLLAYAKIAHGFVYTQPRAIAQAQTLLQRLGRYQDVHLEQAVCALLLGQTEAAGRLVERSQDYEPLAFIREQSQAAPDLLPGLCLYGERWLQTEVLPHFRDTHPQTLSLKDYFADETVQAHLEQLSTGRQPVATPAPHTDSTAAEQAAEQTVSTPTTAAAPAAVVMPAVAQAAVAAAASPAPTTLQPPNAAAAPPQPTVPGQTIPEQIAVAVAEPPSQSDLIPPAATDSTPSIVTPTHLPPAPEDLPVAPRSQARSQRQAQIQRNRWILLGVCGLFALICVSFLFSQLRELLSPQSPQLETTLETDVPEAETIPSDNSSDPESLSNPTPTLGVAPPTTASVDPLNPEPIIATDEPIDELLAQAVVETWLAVKSLAWGPEYQTNRLDVILTEPELSRRQQAADTLRTDNKYWDYEHSIEIEKLTTDGNNPDRAAIEAAVREQATPYRNGQPEPGGAYDDNLRVRYDLVRQGDQWLIQDMQVLQ
ncbi:MAG: IMS domain-containing protein [Cyanobacteria bacterium P01_G01_bin.54]